jgi:hypothetical protein
MYLHVVIGKHVADGFTGLWNVASDSLVTVTKLQMYALDRFASCEKS